MMAKILRLVDICFGDRLPMDSPSGGEVLFPETRPGLFPPTVKININDPGMAKMPHSSAIAVPLPCPCY